jgi:hypothetical protein
MHRIWIIPVVVVLSIAAVTGVISATSDWQVLVPPPEAVGEAFLRAVETERFSQALPYLDENLRGSVDEKAMRDLLMRLERQHGKIKDVRGEHSEVRGEEADAEVTIRTAAGEIPLRLHFRREKQLWKVAALPQIAAHREGIFSPACRSSALTSSSATTNGSVNARSAWLI